MKILFIVPYAPNLIRVRSYQLICSLARRGHQVTVATLWTNEAEREDLDKLRVLGVTVVAHPVPIWRSLVNTLVALPTQTPLQAVYSWQPALAHTIRMLIQTQRFDVVHTEHLRGACYGLLARSLKRQDGSSVPVVWDSVDCISHLFQQAVQNSRSLKGRVLTGLDLKRTQPYEGKLVRQFAHVLVTSPTDQRALAQLADQASTIQREHARPSDPIAQNHQIHVLPNGVDLAYFTPNGAQREAATIVFSGKMSYHANITAVVHLVNEIMPQVWSVRPDAKVVLVGKDPTAAVRALERPNVVVTGTVADLRPFLQHATIAVAPIPYGAGIQNKVLEAMACAAPMIASPQASSALQVQAGQDLLIAPTTEHFAQTIVQLLANRSQQAALGRAGRTYVEHYHAWDTAATQLEDIYQTAIVEHQSRLSWA